MLDLIVAVGLGIASINGSPLQLIHADAGSAAMTVLPWSPVPTVLVSFFLMVHALVFAKLSARANSSANSSIAVDELAGGLRPAG